MPVEHLLSLVHDHMDKHDYDRKEGSGQATVHSWKPRRGGASWRATGKPEFSGGLHDMGWKKDSSGDKWIWDHPNGARLIDHISEFCFYPNPKDE